MKKDELIIRKLNDQDVQLTGGDNEFTHSIEKGVTDDVLNIKALTFWSIITVIYMIVMVYGGYQIYTYWGFKSKMDLAINAEYKELNSKVSADQEHLNTFGIVNADSGVYRIPIENAFDLYVQKQSTGK
jgi:hypothetical protein